MKKVIRRKLFVTIIAFLGLMMISANATYAEHMMVMQPAYGGMSFYVHQPVGIPANWYTTLSGYPVWRGTGGMWFYGSYFNNTIIQTNYVVGSVVPAVVGIYPYTVVTHYAPAVVIPTTTRLVGMPYFMW